MIQVVAEQHREGILAGKWDIHVYDGSEAGDLLVFSNQGYENLEEAKHIVDRLFHQLEPVDLAVRYADGKGSHRMIR